MDENQLHPIAEKAASLWAGKRFDAQAIDALSAELDALRDNPALGPALESLLRVASYLDQKCGDRRAADLLLSLALEMRPALEAQNERARLDTEDRQRRRIKDARKWIS